MGLAKARHRPQEGEGSVFKDCQKVIHKLELNSLLSQTGCKLFSLLRPHEHICRSPFTMPNKTRSILKRRADAAFNEETDRGAGKVRRKAHDALKLQHDYDQITELAPSEQSRPESPKEHAGTQWLANGDLEAKKPNGTPPKVFRLLQNPHNAQRARPHSTPLDSQVEQTVAHQPAYSSEEQVNTGGQTVKKIDRKSTPRRERKQTRKIITKKPSSDSQWMLTAPEGGRFTNHDPILVQNDGSATFNPCSGFRKLTEALHLGT